MGKKKVSCAKAAYFLKDERKAAKEYRELGLPSLAKDEARHAKFFRKLLKKGCE